MTSPRNCPICGRPVDEPQRATVPFCSERCHLIDLGSWLTDGARAIPGQRAVGERLADADQTAED